ncbi:hypothetical protein GCM10017044_03420 [Kordiimonas sediminis]|uniref:Peroxiredoxin n=1 Tax=Kordiimonas sediminis TaxID=1735581 RepID=A0A919E4N8_9PROT|nr:DsrE family protein [Kordiimonas sediminis]GHF12771.1 hypothetical protein GCM10017044_03420 [Kordiimonas sediminis]
MSKKYPMTLIILSPDVDKIHMAMTLAVTAASEGRPTSLFFAKKAADVLTRGGWDRLCQAEGYAAGAFDAHHENAGLPDFALLAQALGAVNARFLICDAAVTEYGITSDQLLSHPHIEVLSLGELLKQGFGGDWMTF